MSGRTPLELAGRSVLVTGASSGLGRAMALDLAQHYGAHVIAVARRGNALEELAAQVPGKIEPMASDLGDFAARTALLDVLRGRDLAAVVLNAGVTATGPFEEAAWPDLEALITLNITATAHLAHQLLPRLQARKGALLLVSSLGGAAPLPYQALYSGSKAFVTQWGLALAAEQGGGCSVTVSAPGGIDTAMTEGTAFDGQRRHLMPSKDVARQSLDAMAKRKTLVIPGVHNRTMALAVKLLPARWIAALLERQFREDMKGKRP